MTRPSRSRGIRFPRKRSRRVSFGRPNPVEPPCCVPHPQDEAAGADPHPQEEAPPWKLHGETAGAASHPQEEAAAGAAPLTRLRKPPPAAGAASQPQEEAGAAIAGAAIAGAASQPHDETAAAEVKMPVEVSASLLQRLIPLSRLRNPPLLLDPQEDASTAGAASQPQGDASTAGAASQPQEDSTTGAASQPQADASATGAAKAGA